MLLNCRLRQFRTHHPPHLYGDEMIDLTSDVNGGSDLLDLHHMRLEGPMIQKVSNILLKKNKDLI